MAIPWHIPALGGFRTAFFNFYTPYQRDQNGPDSPWRDVVRRYEELPQELLQQYSLRECILDLAADWQEVHLVFISQEDIDRDVRKAQRVMRAHRVYKVLESRFTQEQVRMLSETAAEILHAKINDREPDSRREKPPDWTDDQLRDFWSEVLENNPDTVSKVTVQQCVAAYDRRLQGCGTDEEEQPSTAAPAPRRRSRGVKRRASNSGAAAAAAGVLPLTATAAPTTPAARARAPAASATPSPTTPAAGATAPAARARAPAASAIPPPTTQAAGATAPAAGAPAAGATAPAAGTTAPAAPTTPAARARAPAALATPPPTTPAAGATAPAAGATPPAAGATAAAAAGGQQQQLAAEREQMIICQLHVIVRVKLDSVQRLGPNLPRVISQWLSEDADSYVVLSTADMSPELHRQLANERVTLLPLDSLPIPAALPPLPENQGLHYMADQLTPVQPLPAKWPANEAFKADQLLHLMVGSVVLGEREDTLLDLHRQQQLPSHAVALDTGLKIELPIKQVFGWLNQQAQSWVETQGHSAMN